MVFQTAPGNCSDCCAVPTCNIGQMCYTPAMDPRLLVVAVGVQSSTAYTCTWWTARQYQWPVNSQYYIPRGTRFINSPGKWLCFYDSEDSEFLYYRRDFGGDGPQIDVVIRKPTTLDFPCDSGGDWTNSMRVWSCRIEDPDGGIMEYECDAASNAVVKTFDCGSTANANIIVTGFWPDYIIPATSLPSTITITASGFTGGCSYYNGSYSCALSGVNGEEDGWVYDAAWQSSGAGYAALRIRGDYCCADPSNLFTSNWQQANLTLTYTSLSCASSAYYLTNASAKADHPYNGGLTPPNFYGATYISGSAPCAYTTCPAGGSVSVTF